MRKLLKKVDREGQREIKSEWVREIKMFKVNFCTKDDDGKEMHQNHCMVIGTHGYKETAT